MKLPRRRGDDSPPSPHPGDADAPEVRTPSFKRLGLPEGLAGLRAVMDRLLAEDGCPWDREQTLDSLRPYLLEEAYEVLEAMDDPDRHRDELGDLLFQIVFQAALRERDGDFDLGDVIATIRDKLLRRHPHVFGAAPGAPRLSPQEVSTQWEAIKAAERRAAGRDDSRSSASKVSRRLPALIRTGRMQDAASKLGFDWPSIDGAVAKFREEWDELEQARRHAADDPSPQTHAEVQAEFGDLLFVLVRIGQKLGLDAEQALRGANDKFERRFAHVLARCEEHGLDPATAGLDTLEGFWTEAKRTAPAGPGPGRAAAIDGDDPSNA